MCGVQILPDGELKPQAKHLQTRTDYLLKVLRKTSGCSVEEPKPKVDVVLIVKH